MLRFGLLASIALLALGCDPSAHAEGGKDRGATSGQQLETCAAQRDCAPGLRCRNDTCWPAHTSRVGDFYEALGFHALATGDTARATTAFNHAVSQYHADKLEPPAGLLCNQGHALVAARDIPERAEQAARVLHSCVLAVPAGSVAYQRAMGDLALLDQNGLEPLALASTSLANAYLTRPGSQPSADDLKVTVASANPKPAAKSFAGWVLQIQSPEVRNQLVPCWEANWKKNHKPSLKVTLPFQYRWEQGVYADQDRGRLTIDHPPTTPAAACVAKVLAPLADAYSKKSGHGTWTADLTITVGK